MNEVLHILWVLVLLAFGWFLGDVLRAWWSR